MTQQEVMNVLGKFKRKWLDAKAISVIIGKSNLNTTRFNLLKLFNQGIVLRKEEGKGVKKHYIYYLK